MANVSESMLRMLQMLRSLALSTWTDVFVDKRRFDDSGSESFFSSTPFLSTLSLTLGLNLSTDLFLSRCVSSRNRISFLIGGTGSSSTSSSATSTPTSSASSTISSSSSAWRWGCFKIICLGFRLTKRDGYFWVNFDYFWSERCGAVMKFELSPKPSRHKQVLTIKARGVVISF